MTTSSHQSKSHKTRNIVLGIVSSHIILIIIAIVNNIHREIMVEEQAQQAKARLAADPLTTPFIYNALNKERSDVGANALASVSNLNTAADQYCNDMVSGKYFDYKNPTSGKESASFITDNSGDLYLKRYVASIFSAMTSTDTATDAITRAIGVQATNLNDPLFNSVGWSICQSPNNPDEKYIVGMLAEKADKPVPPTTVYVPSAPSVPAYTPPTTCNTTYYDGYGYSNPTATTRCY